MSCDWGCDNLGWSGGEGTELVELIGRDDLLVRVLRRLRDSATTEQTALATTWEENRTLAERNGLADEVITTSALEETS